MPYAHMYIFYSHAQLQRSFFQLPSRGSLLGSVWPMFGAFGYHLIYTTLLSDTVIIVIIIIQIHNL
jgi:hypothetical protein